MNANVVAYCHLRCRKNHKENRRQLNRTATVANVTEALRIDSSTDLDDRYSNLFLNAYINRHAHTEYLQMTEVYSPLGIWHVFSI